MEVNKEQAEKCRDLGAAALRQQDYIKAAKMLKKSLQLYPLPGVEALAAHATAKLAEQTNANSTRPPTAASNIENTPPSRSSSNVGEDGRSYTPEQEAVVKKVLTAREGGRGAHYRVLGIAQTANESEIKKAYRKLSLKVHPDKNSAPGAVDAFKVVSLAYATLSDDNKRTIYDRYGDEDPDHRGGGGGRGGVRMRHGGQEMSPEDIFNAFFNAHMGGGNGVHFHSTGFGPGFHFRQGQPRRGQRQAEQPNTGFAALFQLAPILLFILLSLFSSTTDSFSSSKMPGEEKYFSLTNKPPFTNPVVTKLSKVRDIPYFVTDSFRRSYLNDAYNRKRVEVMVEGAYENFLSKECQKQKVHKQREIQNAKTYLDPKVRNRQLNLAQELPLNRCDELNEFFPQQRQQRYF